MAADDATENQPLPAVLRDGFWFAFACCAILYLAPIWSFKYLPMVDLPQRAAQVWLWSNYDRPEIAERFEVHLFTPYLLTYVIARGFALVMDIHAAMRALISLTVLALPLAMISLLRASGGNRWWSLLGFPISFGASFYWGFTPYMAAVPLTVFTLAGTWRFAYEPTWRRGLGLAALSLTLFFTHGLAWAFAMTVCTLFALVHFKKEEGLRGLFGRALPYLPGLPLALYWVTQTRLESEFVQKVTVWDLGFKRLLFLPSHLSDIAPNTFSTVWGLVLLALLGSVCLYRVPRIKRDWRRWVPLAVALGCYVFLPSRCFGTIFVYSRFAVFLTPFAFAALPAAEDAKPARGLSWVLLALILSGAGLLWSRTGKFDVEARTLDPIIEAMEPGKKVGALVYLRVSEDWKEGEWGIPWHFHTPMWYQVEKGGEVQFTFAMFFAEPVRYRPEARLPILLGDYIPPQPITQDLLDTYDYFLVRGSRDFGALLFPNPGHGFVLLKNHGRWWLYGRATLAKQNP